MRNSGWREYQLNRLRVDHLLAGDETGRDTSCCWRGFSYSGQGLRANVTGPFGRSTRASGLAFISVRGLQMLQIWQGTWNGT
mmetsp:Transcript_5641/g.8960  ORF Transcript_5641/g.8960 Transcript_5641/m.8960 type:complete len:82 (+) Transcript_5641:529-774(+)